jgi:hypothetical protein
MISYYLIGNKNQKVMESYKKTVVDTVVWIW